MSREHWVTHEQLDTPLNELFPGTRTTNTARQYVFICEVLLNLPPGNLEAMEYEDMNRYMDRLDVLMQRMANQNE